MSNIGDIQRALSGSIASPYGSAPTIAQMLDLQEFFSKAAADGMASTATADTLLWTNPYDFPVAMVSAKWVCTGAALTNDNTNNAVITLKSNDGAGGATAIGLTLTTSITLHGATLLQNQSNPFDTVTGAGINIPSGGGLWLNIAKGGTGVVVPISLFVIRLRRGEFTGV
jgi:hypothetical protein